MTLLKKLNIDCGEQSNNFEDVPVPVFGKDVKIRVQKLKTAGSIRLSRLYKTIDEMKIEDRDQLNIYQTVAMLMCVMVDEDGQYLVPGDDVVSTMNALEDKGVIFRLFTASNRVNSISIIDKDETLEDTKKNS